MRAATLPLLAAALTLGACATSDIKRCTDFSGIYRPSACRQREKKALTDILLPDGSKLAGVGDITVTQTGCTTIRISSAGREDITLRPDDDSAVRWTVNGELMGGTPPESQGSILPGFSRTSREWTLALTESGKVVYTDAHDERGLALLLLPFHSRTEAACDWLRVAPTK